MNLEIDGRALESQTITVQPGEPGFRHVPALHARARLHARHRAHRRRQPEAGQRFNFVMSPAQRLPVLILDAPRALARRQPVPAARAGDRHDAGLPGGRAGRRTSVSSADLERNRVVILNDAAAISAPAMRSSDSCRRAAACLSCSGNTRSGAPIPTTCCPACPATSSIARDAAARWPSSTTAIPILELFKAPRSGDLSTARFFRYRAITMKPEPAGARDGEARPDGSRDRAVRRRRGGDGRAEASARAT